MLATGWCGESDEAVVRASSLPAASGRRIGSHKEQGASGRGAQAPRDVIAHPLWRHRTAGRDAFLQEPIFMGDPAHRPARASPVPAASGRR